MEQRGIRITGAGTAVVNQNLTVVDPSASGNAREWRGTSDVTDQRVVVYYVSGGGWVIASVDKLKIYYSIKAPSEQAAEDELLGVKASVKTLLDSVKKLSAKSQSRAFGAANDRV